MEHHQSFHPSSSQISSAGKMPEVTSKSPAAADIASYLPLKLIKSEIVPPAPSRPKHGSEHVIDWLLDFAGYSWIVYGASSLLVISHFPNPSSQAEAKIGPVFRQVLELSRSRGSDVCVSAVSWSPAEPCVGELGAAIDECIQLFSYNSDDTSSSSFCWSQTAVLSQTTKVEAIQWTGSGDGIISVGIEVMFWRRNVKSWEIAWKFRPKVPQTLISTTWSLQGLSATAPCGLNSGVASSLTNEARNYGSLANNSVLICQGDGRSKYMQAELHHPMPVGMIQWRPSTGKPLSRHVVHAPRSVLLTCSLDGAVRLWSEIDAGRIRRAGKDSNDHRSPRLSFCVIGVIEVYQTLNGSLGSDIFVFWATEVESIKLLYDEACYSCLNDSQYDDASRCEWLIGLGPDRATTLWAVHCLDHFAPVRFPRITLWKKQELVSSEMETSQVLVRKVFMMRNLVCGPPVTCSLVQLSPCNSFTWIQLYFQRPTREGKSANGYNTENHMPSQSKGIMKADGHTGKILQIAVHPSISGVELAASLDRHGMLLFWSFSTFFSSHIGLPTSTPSWKLYGKILFSGCSHSPNYTCLCWAPTILSEDRALLLGHSDGIDCFILQTSKGDEHNLSFHKLCSIPFGACGHQQRVSRICSIPLPPNCDETVSSCKFLLVALWMDRFQALSWEITIHYNGSCCFCDDRLQIFESDFAGKKYIVSVEPCSSVIPAPHDDDQVTSYSVACPNDLIVSLEQKLSSDSGRGGRCYAYHMITGCLNGSLKLWRSLPTRSSSSGANWDLVGVLSSGQGSITALTPSPCCQKIATASPSDQQNCSSILCIWECMHVHNAGIFLLEDKLCLDGEVVALSWLMMGNGQLLLGVCLQSEVRVYALRRCGHQNFLKSGKPMEKNIWHCIAVHSASPAIHNFLWGPRGTIIVVHDKYFSIFSQFLLLADEDFLSKCCPKFCQDGPFCCNGGIRKLMLSTTFTDSKEPSMKINGQYQFSSEVNMRDDPKSYVQNCEQMHDILTKIWFWSMSEIAENMGGSLPLYHPETLLINIASGNFKRASVALRHLVKDIASNGSSKTRYGTKVPRNVISPLPLSNYLEGLPTSSSNDNLFQWSSSQPRIGLSQFTSGWGHNDPHIGLTSSSQRSEFVGFIEALNWLHRAGCMTNIEMMQAISLVDLLQEVSDPHSTSAYGSLDEPGRRFWVAVRFQRLFFSRRFNRLPLVEELDISSELIGWAFHSDCHENLFNSLLSAEPSWEEMRSIGVGFWYSNVAQLRLKMERLARQQYMRNKDPKACSLLYIALNRIQVLAGLFRISKDDKDKPLATFLLRNFQEDNNKAAALKNAYVLMGKHQLELAVAFFLLGGDHSSAVTVCAKNLGDEQLALVICRLIEGYGGPSEHNLISKFLLPSALSKDNNWMASFLEWVLGNHSQSFLRILGVEMSSESNSSILSSLHAPFLDPSISQYCMMLATKTVMKNAIGEYRAAVLSQWAVLMNVTSLSRCGLPLEALECHSSSISFFGSLGQGSTMQSPGHNVLVEMLKPPADKHFLNWISKETSHQIMSHSKLNLAMQYLSNLLTEHPSSADIETASFGMFTNYNPVDQEFEKSLNEFHSNLTAAIACFQQKFFLIPLHLIFMATLFFHHKGLEFIGNNILHEYMLKVQSDDKCHANKLFSHPIPSDLLLKAAEEFSCIFAKYVLFSCVNCHHSSYLDNDSIACEARFCWLAAWGFSNQGITWSFGCLTAMLRLILRPYTKEFEMMLFHILALVKYHVFFSSAWLHRNLNALLVIVRPILTPLMRGNVSNELTVEDLNALLSEIVEKLTHESTYVQLPTYVEIDGRKQEQNVGSVPSAPEAKSWELMSGSLWVHMVKFLEHQLNTLPVILDGVCPSPTPSLSIPDCKNLPLEMGLVSSTLVEFLKLTKAGVSFYCSRQFVVNLLQEVDLPNKLILSYLENGFPLPELGDKYNNKSLENTEFLDSGSELSALKKLWLICADRRITHGAFEQEYCNWLPYVKQKSFGGWGETYINISREYESEETSFKKDRLDSPTHAVGSPLACLSPDDHPFKSFGGNDMFDMKKTMPFHNPKEIYKRNGELLEALCINSVDNCQGAVASNRKGIMFFNWEDGLLHMDKSDSLWEEADWPHNGWAGSESTPVPTCVSPGVGLGSTKDTHLGLGGATIGAAAVPRAGWDLTGGGAFGIPGYAGVGASGLGWGVQDGFDEFVDPPATVDNVRSRALASHPSRPFFMVGSSNTHIYLWEFGEERAIATYGVLPAANVPPPYALASVSAVRFDNCGHRFATAALDGTVCTWQLEVGGQSNIRPTESSACFSNHTSDVTYVTASGSIIAASGYSSNGVNVVVWDTLAPPATSQASIMCHEGGARSLSVFDNDIGSGSISPLILTGGKEGDVGLHDFRYIATGKTKRHKHFDTGEHNINASSSGYMQNKTGDQNRNGMLWYIPKAHSGSVTKITTIPNTSFFLTGSKDGDVKLWDAKMAKLVFHWPRLHERHTFLQPSSRGFGEVVRAAVTDIQVVPQGFLSCGGDGLVKFIRFHNFRT
ncbi:uncharacterized protein [Primulina huaijiensis]|uniref:uncharacterized protein isoform X1 n=1 Tax=Primulina huaijiensis TaxID=1492673 RepID=UPI003CC713F5